MLHGTVTIQCAYVTTSHHKSKLQFYIKLRIRCFHTPDKKILFFTRVFSHNTSVLCCLGRIDVWGLCQFDVVGCWLQRRSLNRSRIVFLSCTLVLVGSRKYSQCGFNLSKTILEHFIHVICVVQTHPPFPRSLLDLLICNPPMWDLMIGGVRGWKGNI